MLNFGGGCKASLGRFFRYMAYAAYGLCSELFSGCFVGFMKIIVFKQLGSVLKHFHFYPLLGEMIPVDYIIVFNWVEAKFH